ncbi:signal peptidase complex catalytic subunit SEC11A-like [Planococcus citri]|uniref:signal peptidase complex catalytic subunit SEC11A-like n=1 Tax=Planococcus citri TaxID=170843 RepID=UPI0031F7A148
MASKCCDVFLTMTGYDLKNGRNRRQFFDDFSQIGIAISLVVILWKILITATNCTNPIVVVVSGSMEPAYYRGDLLFVTHYDDQPVRIGDVIIFSVKTHPNRLVHRVIKLHQSTDPSKVKILTKGDNNAYDDSTGLYAPGQKWLKNKDIHGKVKGYLPYIGYMTILLTEFRPFVIVFAAVVFIYWSRTNDDSNETTENNESEKEEEETSESDE